MRFGFVRLVTLLLPSLAWTAVALGESAGPPAPYATSLEMRHDPELVSHAVMRLGYEDDDSFVILEGAPSSTRMGWSRKTLSPFRYRQWLHGSLRLSTRSPKLRVRTLGLFSERNLPATTPWHPHVAWDARVAIDDIVNCGVAGDRRCYRRELRGAYGVSTYLGSEQLRGHALFGLLAGFSAEPGLDSFGGLWSELGASWAIRSQTISHLAYQWFVRRGASLAYEHKLLIELVQDTYDNVEAVFTFQRYRDLDQLTAGARVFW